MLERCAKEMESVIRFQILNKVACVSLDFTALGEGMFPYTPSQQRLNSRPDLFLYLWLGNQPRMKIINSNQLYSA